jgi:hypothetical protein
VSAEAELPFLSSLAKTFAAVPSAVEARMGILRGYLCKRCPLAFEIGGFLFWDLDGRREQAVCRVCGTMHRLTEEENGICHVAALPGPVRSLPLVKKVDSTGYEYEDYEWPAENEWKPVGKHPGGIDSLGQLACARCDAAGKMQSLTLPSHPDGFWLSFREVCPLCDGPMPCLYDTTVN